MSRPSKMSGHGPIYDYSTFPLRELRRALGFMGKLDKIGFEQDEDLKFSIDQEIRYRMKKTSTWKQLPKEEEQKYRKWARDNYVKGSSVDVTWHPIVRSECRIMNSEP